MLRTALLAVVLLPVSGLAPFAFQVFSPAADRYMYLAMLAPTAALACLVAQFSSGWRITGPAVALCALLGIRAAGQVRYWQDTQTLFTHNLRVA